MMWPIGIERPGPCARVPRSVRPSGFTLLEIVVVSLIMTMLMLATVPKFQRTAQRLRLERAVFELAQLLRSAHAQAVSDGSEHVLVWDTGTRRARIDRVPADGPPEAVHGPAGASAPLMEGAEVEVTRDGRAVTCGCVRFFPDGTSDAATVTVAFRDRVYRMMVDGPTSQVLLATGPAAR